ncbi:MAG: hypothetical protein JWM10_5375 [Myxococcaceae bacterium]|nr:hypothetical protein [Myxococcaceae bacterium]
MGPIRRDALALALLLVAPLTVAQPRRVPQPQAPAQQEQDEPGPDPSNPTAAFQQAEARTHFQTGVGHYQAGRFTEAIAEFQTAHRLFASPTILFNLAQAYRSDGQLSNAITTFRRYIDENPRLTATQREDVEGVIREIETTRAVLSFEVEPSGAEISLDGRPLGTSPLPRGVEVLPGPHEVAVTLALHEPLTQTINVHAHERRLFQANLHPVELNARLVVNALPADAEITLDGAVVGRGTYDQRVRPGPHQLSFAAPGYQPRSESVTVRTLSEETVRVTLEARSRSVFTRWYFWAAVGGVIAVGATLAVVLNPIEPSAIPGNGTPSSVQSVVSW